VSNLIVKLPRTCACGCLTGKIVANTVVCDGCGQTRFPVSELTLRTLMCISQMFGAPTEPIVFRSSDAREKIERQDMLLQNKYGSDGRSFHQIIGDVVDDPLSDSSGVEAVDSTEL
jgi:hypothetical protein